MGIKLHCLIGKEENAVVKQFVFHCPGCGYGHGVRVRGPDPVWNWNGSEESPTFQPSLLVNKDDPKTRCHSFITDGKIQFLADCHHSLRGQTVELPDWEFE